MDAITLLKNDHRTVERLFRRYEQAGDRAYAEKRKVVDRIIEELSKHAAVEEQVFYPTARAEAEGTETIARESIEEHHIVKWELAELEKMDPRDERFDAKVRVLIENVRHHVSEEESELFPKVREELGRNELNDIGDAMEAARSSAPTRPHPRSPQSGPLALIAGPVMGVADRVTGTVKGAVGGAARTARRATGRAARTVRRSSAASS
jgi:hemerythrin superfamily protein